MHGGIHGIPATLGWCHLQANAAAVFCRRISRLEAMDGTVVCAAPLGRRLKSSVLSHAGAASVPVPFTRQQVYAYMGAPGLESKRSWSTADVASSLCALEVADFLGDQLTLKVCLGLSRSLAAVACLCVYSLTLTTSPPRCWWHAGSRLAFAHSLCEIVR